MAVFTLDDVDEEDFSGKIGELLKLIQAIPTHTKEKRHLVSELRKVCEAQGYLEFQGYTNNFHIEF